jgi:hypothetical protein
MASKAFIQDATKLINEKKCFMAVVRMKTEDKALFRSDLGSFFLHKLIQDASDPRVYQVDFFFQGPCRMYSVHMLGKYMQSEVEHESSSDSEPVYIGDSPDFPPPLDTPESSEPDESFTLNVLLPTGAVLKFQVTLDDTIGDFKDSYGMWFDGNPEKLRLLGAGTILTDDDKTFRDYGFEPCFPLTVVFEDESDNEEPKVDVPLSINTKTIKDAIKDSAYTLFVIHTTDNEQPRVMVKSEHKQRFIYNTILESVSNLIKLEMFDTVHRCVNVHYGPQYSEQFESTFFQIYVKGNSKTLTYFIRNCYSVITLKSLIYGRQGVPRHEQSIIFSGKTLQNDKLMTDYTIVKESHLELNMKLEGGMPVIKKTKNAQKKQNFEESIATVAKARSEVSSLPHVQKVKHLINVLVTNVETNPVGVVKQFLLLSSVDDLDKASAALSNPGGTTEYKMGQAATHLFGESGNEIMSTLETIEALQSSMKHSVLFAFSALLNKEGYKNIADIKHLINDVKSYKLGQASSSSSALAPTAGESANMTS